MLLFRGGERKSSDALNNEGFFQSSQNLFFLM
jgi:hypothetical protein